MSFEPRALTAAGPAIAMPAGVLPTDVWLAYAQIKLLEPEPELLAEWSRRLDRLVLGAEDRRLARSWYILRVNSRQERFVAGALNEAGFAAYYPVHVTKPKHATRKAAICTRPLMPGYVFACLPDDEATVQALAIRNVIDRLQFGGEAVRVPPLEMGSLILADACFAFDETWEPPRIKGRRYSHAWKPGERLKIEGGAFDGFLAEVRRGHGRDHMAVLLTIFGRATEVVVEHRQLVKP
jgi:transcription antitermination factor NusG